MESLRCLSRRQATLVVLRSRIIGTSNISRATLYWYIQMGRGSKVKGRLLGKEQLGG